MCEDTEAKNFPNARGNIILNQYFSGIEEALGTLHINKMGSE
jgi:hypothetical protein